MTPAASGEHGAVVRSLFSGLGSRWVWVSLATLIYWICPQSVRLFYPLRLEALGASDFVVGLAVAGSSVAGLVLAVPSGYLLDRFNSQRVLVFSSMGLAATVGGFALVRSLAEMSALMFVQGLFQMWVWLVLQEMITRVGRGREAARQLSIFSLAWGVGMAAGPSLAAWAYGWAGFQLLMTGCCALTLVTTACAFLVPAVLRERSPRDDEGKEAAKSVEDEMPPPATEAAMVERSMFAALRRSFASPVVVGVMASSFVNISVQSLRTSFYPLFLEGRGVSLGVIGLLLSCIGVSSLVVRLVLPAILRSQGYVRPLVWSTWVAVVGMAITPVWTNGVFLAVGAVMIGWGLGANPPITVELLASHMTNDRGTAVGLRMVANRTAQVAQPFVFGALAATIGLATAFPVVGAVLGAATLWMGHRLAPMRSRDRRAA